MTARLRVLKTVLWALVGVLGAVTVARFVNGLGAVTNLSDAAPWGLWIALDVMSGVALAAGGFVLAGTVYVFGLKRYRPFVRPAVLTAFLGYAAVAAGLLYDLGLPWHIWHPMIYPQPHSVLFEVAMCVMLYLTVLGLEFAPTVLEHPLFARPLFRRIYELLKKATPALVIAGIVLSTLHQSSLGSLFLIAPHRLHPLWYSPYIYVLFFVSAVGLGLMTVVLESAAAAYFLGHKPRPEPLARLAGAGGIVLALYVALRLGDLAARGRLSLAFDGSFEGTLFLSELAVSAVVPALLLSLRRVRHSKAGRVFCAAAAAAGMIMYRTDVCLTAFSRPPGVSYFPSWLELAVSAGLVAGAGLIFIFFAERLKVYEEEPEPAAEKGVTERPDRGPEATQLPAPPETAAPRLYSAVAVAAAALTVLFLPEEAVTGAKPRRTPVFAARTVEGFAAPRPAGTLAAKSGGGRLLRALAPEEKPPAGVPRLRLMALDGNRNGKIVLFDHHAHAVRLRQRGACAACHHLNLPHDRNSSCWECHRDEFEPTPLFDHNRHVKYLDGNAGCTECHPDSTVAKTFDTAAACADCHADDAPSGSRVKLTAAGRRTAPGYREALHELCISCHKEADEKDRAAAAAPNTPNVGSLADCATCHQGERLPELRRRSRGKQGRPTLTARRAEHRPR